MKKKCLLILLSVICCFSSKAQQERNPQNGMLRCNTMEVDAARRAQDPSLGTLQDFENWIQPLVRSYQQNATAQRAVITIPIVFHIIHNGGADNLSATYINAQIAQLNEDFRKLGAGFNTHPAGADCEILFCAATLNPTGGTMAEPGIDRVLRTTKGFTAPPYSSSYYESTIKPNTYWDPTQYCNVWVSNLSGGLLGYAQFPEAASLPGIGTGNGGATTDGVVILYTSVGSIAIPHPLGDVYAAGRTLTHELGHWVGLRHIWGDGPCSADDYCNDTPRASSANFGCPTTRNSCNDLLYGSTTDPFDMVQNYMDYTDDACMNIFTNNQKSRMQIVMTSSIRRASLTTSGKCGTGGGTTDTQAPSVPTNVTASNITSTTANLSWTASTDNVGVVSYNIYRGGVLVGNSTGTTTTLTGLTASTTYSVGVAARDAAGNQSNQGTTSFTTLAGGAGSQLLFGHYFELGLDGWVDGGSDCARYSGVESWEGDWSVQLRDNSGTASAMTLSNVNVTGFNQLDFKFYFYPNSMETGEDFWVLFHDGTAWKTVATFTRGTNFNNGSYYTATVVLSSANYNFGTNAQFRIQCDASKDDDQIYIDQVTLTGVNSSRTNGSYFTVEQLDSKANLVDVIDPQKNVFGIQNELVIYPNPANNEITIKSNFEDNTLSVYSLSGNLVKEIKMAGSKTILNISDLEAGTYFIHAESKDGIAINKFIKQ